MVWKWYRWVWLACPTRRRARSSSICAIRVLCSAIPMSGKAMVQGSVARGLEAAGSNSAGSMAGFMGMGLGMNAGGSFVGAASQANQAQREAAAVRLLPLNRLMPPSRRRRLRRQRTGSASAAPRTMAASSARIVARPVPQHGSAQTAAKSCPPMPNSARTAAPKWNKGGRIWQL